MAEVSPSILSADFANLADALSLIREGGASMVHVDVMDGHFVPNITIGPPVVASLRKATDRVLDCHLMVRDPEQYAPRFMEAGADMVSVHQEATPHLHRVLESIRSRGVQAGVVLNPATPVSTLADVVDEVDYVLIMSVNPGFGAQSFIPRALDKVRELRLLREDRGLGFRIQVDGGVSEKNIGSLIQAGADILVVGAAIFLSENPRVALGELMRLASESSVTYRV